MQIIPLTKFRNELPKFKRQAQLYGLTLAVSYYGEIVGYLVPLALANKLDASGAMTRGMEDISLKNFRTDLLECWEKLQVDLDCFYLTAHSCQVAAFVSPRFKDKIEVSEAA